MRFDAGGAMTFLRPDGRPLPDAPAAPAWDGPALAPVDARLRAAGIDIDADTAPRWQGERLDLGWAIGVLWRPRAGADPAAGVPAGASGSWPPAAEVPTIAAATGAVAATTVWIDDSGPDGLSGALNTSPGVAETVG